MNGEYEQLSQSDWYDTYPVFRDVSTGWYLFYRAYYKQWRINFNSTDRYSYDAYCTIYDEYNPVRELLANECEWVMDNDV